HSFPVEGLVGDPILGFLDHRILAGGLLAVAFHRNNVRRVHRAHDVEVLALPAQLHKLAANRSDTHVSDLRTAGHLTKELTTTLVVLVNGWAPGFAPFTRRTYAVMFTVVLSSMS